MTTLKRPIVALLSLCMVAGACSSSGNVSTPGSGNASAPKAKKDVAETFKLASTKTLSAESMRFSVNFGFQGIGQMTGEGFEDLKNGTMSMILTVPPFEPGKPAATMEQLLVGDAMYMRSDVFTELLPKGKSWMKIDLAALGKELGVDFAAIMEQSRNSDPRSQLSFLQGTTGDVEELGTLEIRGTQTTHYKFTVDVAKALADLPPEMADVEPLLEDLGLTEFPAEAWIDDEGLVRRINQTMSVPVDDTGQTMSVNISMDFFDFGAKVDVTEPPASQVVDFMKVFEGLE